MGICGKWRSIPRCCRRSRSGQRHRDGCDHGVGSFPICLRVGHGDALAGYAFKQTFWRACARFAPRGLRFTRADHIAGDVEDFCPAEHELRLSAGERHVLHEIAVGCFAKGFGRREVGEARERHRVLRRVPLHVERFPTHRAALDADDSPACLTALRHRWRRHEKRGQSRCRKAHEVPHSLRFDSCRSRGRRQLVALRKGR